ncbi:uncharacterized protein L969DRAFT_96361 [Mixia osmundae IAM 14324]|uniref:1-phosphatidylinositol 4-kinase n=1 Tax=Mixia osmundae (strain CBS 9802 / IAM 14324 / JCM 22182 / KY 12970) TaxID=764103 RepID=G7DWF2_MIXOS|nr:uncharacterized protein L969DRAFT_96361 [Mixia osmundae IAM 14324]KEI37275.1 hypothetical protein L969DRAFT_96361 [Mixia osmundae IAM 14324]GAA94912.1 hypothetical protein E5Q_01567 [Mixia osmundae IAM 14324]
MPTDSHHTLFSAKIPKQTAHHRIIRISPSEAVVLNSADRAPFLLHVEILEDDLDFDPERRQNSEDLRRVLAEMSGTGFRYSRPFSSTSPYASSHVSLASDLNVADRFKPGVSPASNPYAPAASTSSPPVPPDDDLSTTNDEIDLVEQLYGETSLRQLEGEGDAFEATFQNRDEDERAWLQSDDVSPRRSTPLGSPNPSVPYAHSNAGIAALPDESPQVPPAGARRPNLSLTQSSRQNISLDQYAERMRMAAIMLAQLNASQHFGNAGAQGGGNLVSAGSILGAGLGLGSGIGGAVGAGLEAMRDKLPTFGKSTEVIGQASSGVKMSLDTTTAVSGHSGLADSMSSPASQPALLPSSPGKSSANGHIAARQRVLMPSEAAAIRDKIMSEMMALEEERMERMQSKGRHANEAWTTDADDIDVIRIAVNKEDPSGAMLSESWAQKKSRIRKASPYGHLAKWNVLSVIIKTGADLRQEQLAVQLIQEFGRIWREEKTASWVRYFRILVTSEGTGLIETIKDSVSVHSIKKDAYARAQSLEATSMQSYTLYDHFLQTYGPPSSSAFKKAQTAFATSLASYCIICYLLQIKDRHNGNILIDREGHLIHIDFGFMLSNSPGQIGFEMAPFKLTQDYIEILDGYGSDAFEAYKRMMKACFRTVRKHAERIITLVELMQKESKLPCYSLGDQTAARLRERFQLGLSQVQADEYVERLVVSSAASVFTRLYDTYQNQSQDADSHIIARAHPSMGACLSSDKAAANGGDVGKKQSRQPSSAQIDKKIAGDSTNYRKECKILLLGSGESGKSTIVKQMKIINQGGYTRDELLLFRMTIYKNVLDSAQGIVMALRKFKMDPVEPANRVYADKILDYRCELDPSSPLPAEIMRAIQSLWRDSIIPSVLDRSSEFYLMDSASYFFDEVERIGETDYVPSEADVLRCRTKTTGISETKFTSGQLSIHMFDVGGQRSERKKWIHCFEEVTSIIFCVALSEYDQVLLEESGQNRMAESLVLFESVINSRWFLRTSVILFLNKIDLFKIKLPRVPLEKYFPEYTGGADVNKAAKYILWRFTQLNRARLSIYPHLTQATDTSNIRLVFAAAKETILHNALRDSGIL